MTGFTGFTRKTFAPFPRGFTRFRLAEHWLRQNDLEKAREYVDRLMATASEHEVHNCVASSCGPRATEVEDG